MWDSGKNKGPRRVSVISILSFVSRGMIEISQDREHIVIRT